MQDSEDALRGSGRTTAQLLAAPPGATFVWCNRYTTYVQELADFWGRVDLNIVGLHWLRNQHNFLGCEPPSAVVIDHHAYAVMDDKERLHLLYLKDRMQQRGRPVL